jgi:eukaryotic-like serine/threonine-protein kinase
MEDRAPDPDTLAMPAAPIDAADDARLLAAVQARLFARSDDPVRISRYLLLDRVSRGAQGTVYSAYDPRLDRRVAIKIAAPRDGSHEARLREARALARVRHGNVLAIYDAGIVPDSGELFVVTDLIEGCTLRQWTSRPHTWSDLLRVYLAAGRGLAAVHDAGLVHRDFKADNVLVDGDDRVLVADFGLARMLGRPSIERSLETAQPMSASSSAIVGTPAYMPPEQHLGGKIDTRSDQFAFCAALYEALHRRRPFAGDTLAELLEHKLRGAIAPGQPLRGVPAGLIAALRRGLSSAPEDRFDDMRKLLDRLHRVAGTRRRRLAVALALCTIAGTAAIVHGVRTVESRACTDALKSTAPTWDASAHERVAAAFESTELPYATQSWQAAASRLDAYLEQWRAQWSETCDDTGAARPSPSRRCLDRAADAFTSAVGLLEQADAAMIERAHDVVSALPSLEHCTDATVPPSAEGDALRTELHRVELMRTAGRYADAASLADDVLLRASELDDPAVRIAALLASAKVLRTLEDVEGAQLRLFETIALGERTRVEDDAVTEAWLELVSLLLKDDRELPRAIGLAAVVRARIDAAGGPRDLDAYLTLYEGRVAEKEGRSEDALAILRRAVELYRQAFGPDDVKVTVAEETVARVLGRHGQRAEAAELLQHAIAQRVEVLGEGHPLVANGLANLAAQREDPRDAAGDLERALAIYDRSLPSDTRRSFVLCNLGEMQRRLGRYAAAIESLRECSNALAQRSGLDHPSTLHAVTRLVELLAELDRDDEAREQIEHALGSGLSIDASSRERLEAVLARLGSEGA